MLLPTLFFLLIGLDVTIRLSRLIRNTTQTIETEKIEARIIKETSFPIHINAVLDIYDDANIKLPLDIIEDLDYMNLETAKEAYDYIENQRLHWKLENTKKPHRKVDK